MTVHDVGDAAGNLLAARSTNLTASILSSTPAPTIGGCWGPPAKLPKPSKPPAKKFAKLAMHTPSLASRIQIMTMSPATTVDCPTRPLCGLGSRNLVCATLEFGPGDQFRLRVSSGYLAAGTYTQTGGVVHFNGTYAAVPNKPARRTLNDFNLYAGTLTLPPRAGRPASASFCAPLDRDQRGGIVHVVGLYCLLAPSSCSNEPGLSTPRLSLRIRPEVGACRQPPARRRRNDPDRSRERCLNRLDQSKSRHVRTLEMRQGARDGFS